MQPTYLATFIGDPVYLEQAYPATLREEISRHVTIAEPLITAETWRAHHKVLSRADVVLGAWGLLKLDSDFLAAAANLKAVFYAGGTVKANVTDDMMRRGITISSAWRANAIPVAEYTVATTLLSLKQFWRHSRDAHDRRNWRQIPNVRGSYEALVGLVSLGAAGTATARSLSHFDLKLIAYDPLVPPKAAEALGVRLVSLEELFSTSDVVSLHTPWLPETVGMIDGRLLRMLKPGATFINTARGAIVNETELCEVLRERPDLTAILDVTYPEPPAPDSCLYTLTNVILTPHIAGSIGTEVGRMGQYMAQELHRYVEGRPLEHAVTREMLDTAARAY